MKNYRSTGSRILVTAGGTRTSGQAAIDNNFAIWRAFREHGVSIPFPQREVRILNGAA